MSAKRRPGGGRKPLAVPRNKSLPRISTPAHAQLSEFARANGVTIAEQIERLIPDDGVKPSSLIFDCRQDDPIRPCIVCGEIIGDLWRWAADQWHHAANESARWRDAGSAEMATRCEGKKAALAAVKKELLRRMGSENAQVEGPAGSATSPKPTNPPL